MKERDFLLSKIQALTEERNLLPRTYEQEKVLNEARVEAFLLEAGVLSRVKEIRGELETSRKRIQARADHLTGQIEAFTFLFQNFHQNQQAPEPQEEPEEKGGIEADEVTQMEDFSEEDLPEKPSEEDEEEYDEEAEAIENAPDEQALRALLSRYRKS